MLFPNSVRSYWPNQSASTKVNLLMDKWYFVYRIAAHIQSDKDGSFNNKVLEHMYVIIIMTNHHHAMQNS